ncbi:hypothetical protein JYT44_02665 [Caldithrix abyssi]|nr:hypothetical protein [Caldithrix abyssi]
MVNYNLDLSTRNYNDEIEKARPLAANYHYTLGIKYRQDKSKNSQKASAKQFNSALKFVSNFKNAKKLYEETRAAATITLMISPFNGQPNLADFIRDQIMMAQSNASKEFLLIITREQLGTILKEQGLVQAGITENNYMEIGKLSGANHILSGTLTTTYRPVQKISNEGIKQEKEGGVRTVKYVDSTGVEKTKKIKEDVKAMVTHYKKSTGVSLSLTYKIIDVNSGQTIFTGSVSNNANFFHEWATYEGDKRALSSFYKSLIGQNEKFAPSRDELYMAAVRKIPNKLMRKISRYYSN